MCLQEHSWMCVIQTQTSYMCFCIMSRPVLACGDAFSGSMCTYMVHWWASASACVGLFSRMNETWQELHCYLELSLWWCIVLWLYLCEEDGQVASHLALEDFGINSLCSTQWSPYTAVLDSWCEVFVLTCCYASSPLWCLLVVDLRLVQVQLCKSKLVFFVEKQLSPGESCKLACLVFSNYHITNVRTVSV